MLVCWEFLLPSEENRKQNYLLINCKGLVMAAGNVICNIFREVLSFML